MLHWLVSEPFQWGTAESIASTLAGQRSTLRLPVAAVNVYLGGFSVEQTTPLPNALVLHGLVFEQFQWGTAESTESTLASQRSTLTFPVAAVKVYLGGLSVEQTTPLPNDLALRCLVLEQFQWVTAESTESTLASQRSMLRFPVAAVKVHLGGFSVGKTLIII